MSNAKQAKNDKRSSLPTFGRGESSRNVGNHQGSSHVTTAKRRGYDPVWGKTPNWKGGQSGLTELFAEQFRLNKRIRAQSKLARLAVTEVRSTQAEQLRVVNQAILDGSPSVKGVKNPFRERNINEAQRSSEAMLMRQGKQVFESQNPVNRLTAPPSPRSLRSRRKHRLDDCKGRVYTLPEDWFSLKGPFARYYHRQVVRGYKGSPESWIRGNRAAELGTRLTRQGFSLPPRHEWDCCSPNSPLFWPLNKRTVQEQVCVTYGFSSERIIARSTNVVVLRRQAASVQRLKLSDWPGRNHPGQSWPTYPTLAESWMMARRKEFSLHHMVNPVEQGFLARTGIPLNQVKPGSAARTISNLVIGFRADVEIPRKFLAYFRYRWGFLILRRSQRNALPVDLAKLISTIWKEDFSAMLLKYPIRFREALKRLPSNRETLLEGFVRPSPERRLDKTPRRRKGKHERIRDNIPSALKTHGSRVSWASSSDKSDDGVRLC